MVEETVPHKEGLPRMPRVQAILAHARFQGELGRLARAESDRAFCRHGMAHLLDTARIAWMVNLERGLGLDREVVYAAALLHDVGKAEQYAGGRPHDIGGAELADEILLSLPEDRAFSDEERLQIVGAIRGHRRPREGAEVLEQLLYQADKASRACFACPDDVRCSCSWAEAKKNLDLRI